MPSEYPAQTVFLDYVQFIKSPTIIELPRPILGDTRDVVHNMVRTRLPQGGLILFDNPSVWSRNEYRNYTFSPVHVATKVLFENFVKTNLGVNIQFRDMENVVHNVLILNDIQFTCLRSRLGYNTACGDIIDYEFSVRLLKI